MKYIKKITAVTLPMLLIGSFTLQTFADGIPSEKEEVVYIMTNAAGNVTDIEVVNIFNGGDIIDYGEYFAVKVLNTTDQITLNENEITLTSDADKVYYQGTMKETDIPWNISIRYFLDGEEYSAEDIAGKSGALEIRFSLSKNENCSGNFYDSYALQASFTLDTDKCQNIVSSDATVANVGSDKQLTYTILPGKGIETSIYADVTDFEMESTAINGIRLNMNFEVDDAELMDKVDEITSAISSINDGASEVNDGTGKLYDATDTLDSKVSELNSGVGTLTNGAGDLYTGLSSITEENDSLTAAANTTYEGLCSAAETTINAQLNAYGMDSISLTPSTYSAVLTSLLENLNAASEYQPELQAAVQQITALKEQLDNYGIFYQGLCDYTDAVSEAATGAETLKQNMDTLYDNTGILETSVEELKNVAGTLNDGTEELADGTSELADKTSDMDAQISDEIDSMISSLTGGDAEVVSFVSDKNTNVDSVQFVIKTAAIEKEETAAVVETEEKPLTFWQKLLDLFGLN